MFCIYEGLGEVKASLSFMKPWWISVGKLETNCKELISPNLFYTLIHIQWDDTGIVSLLCVNSC